MFEERLKELRKSRNLTQAQMSEILNVKTNTYCQYENNLREPDYKTLKAIADYFLVSIDYLLGRITYNKH